MKQIYTRPLSIHSCCGHFFAGGFRILFNGGVALPLTIFLVLNTIGGSGFAQNSRMGSSAPDAKMIAGNWLVTDARINMLAEVDDTLKLTEKNCFWADHIAKPIPVKIDNQGNVSYEAFGKPASARVAIEGDLLKFIFVAEKALEMGQPVSAENYTDYNFKLNGGQLVIWREDGMVTEKYIFKRQ